MFAIRYAASADKAFWNTLDKNLDEKELTLKIRDKRAYVICDGVKPVGLMRYNLMYDTIPFLTFIYIEEPFQKKGFGGRAMCFWQDEMRGRGHKMVMTSTQVDEQAQHFYRKLGYVDKGGLFLDNTPFEQPQEMFMIKIL